MNTTGVYIDGREKQVDVKRVTELYALDPSAIYTDTFFRNSRKTEQFQREVGRGIAQHFKPSSVIEFGCAAGYHLAGLYAEGVAVEGLEYSYSDVLPYIPEEIRDHVCHGDVMKPHLTNYDMVICLGVAEHILPEKSDILVANVCMARRWIIFSAAKPGQGGCGHINEQPWTYWRSLFGNRGWGQSEEDTLTLRNIYANLTHKSRYSRFMGRSVRVLTKSA